MTKKSLKIASLLVCIIAVFAACSKSESYAEKLKKERKNISRFITDHDIEVLDSYPASGVFGSKQYYKDPTTGVYINVIDSGNGNRADKDKNSMVNIRFWEAMSLPAADSDTVTFNPAGSQPLTIYYGNEYTYTGSTTGSYFYNIQYYFMSKGMAVPLEFVGENAIVSLIVPFNSGSTAQQSSSYPMYFTKLQYTKIIN